MPDCPSMTKKKVGWTKPGRGKKAVDAYQTAQRLMMREMKRWGDEVRKTAKCPPECEEPSNFRFSCEELYVYGKYDWNNDEYVFWIKVRYHARWDCERQPSETVELPGKEVKIGPPVTPSPMGGGEKPEDEEEQPDDQPCTVTVALDQDNSSRSTPGAFDWDIDVTFTASASNPTHYFQPGNTRITQVIYDSTGRFDWRSKLLKTMTDVTSQLSITNGADEASVSGRLHRSPKLNLVAGWGAALKITVVATDVQGDTNPPKNREFIINPK